MPKFAANLTFLFKELPFLERFEAAAEAGFDAVEVLFPYDDAASAVVRRLTASGLPMALINTPPPNWAGGDRGFAAIPGGQARFRSDFKRALRYAERLRPRHIHVMAGLASGQAAHDTFIENLAWAAALARGQSLTIEPLNQVDMPGYFLNDFDLAAQIIAAVNAPNLSLQYDAYHAQMITGDAMAVWERHKTITRHIQIASAPGRHEPAGGNIDFPGFFARLDSWGYVGYVSAEYTPEGRTWDGLGWMKGGRNG